MYELLKQLSSKLRLKYGAGTQSELEELCSNVATDEEVVCFYECYDDILINTSNRVSSTVLSYPFSIWILKLSTLEEPVESRLPKVDACVNFAVKLINLLSQEDTVTGGRASPVLSMTTNQMCGVKLTGVYTGNPLSRC